MTTLNRTAMALIAGKGTQTSLLSSTTYAEAQGELAMATDANRFYIGNSSYQFDDIIKFVLPWALSFRDELVIHNDEIVYKIFG